MRDDGKLDGELNERLIKSIECSDKTAIFGRLADKKLTIYFSLGNCIFC